MVSFITFLLIALQIAAAFAGYFMDDMQPLYDFVVVHASPVMVFFGGLDMVMGKNGNQVFFFWPLMIYCTIKYTLLTISLKNDELGFFNTGALTLEILYVAYSSYYIVTQNYF